MRLFVSVDLPDGMAADLRAIQSPFEDASGLEFTDPEQAHVTLQFLGEVSPDRTDEIEAALESAVERAAVDPFEATFGGLGVFPSPEYIRVLWLGVRDDAGVAELTRLNGAVERVTTDLGFDPDDHEFTPHVTLARMRHAGGTELVRREVDDRDPTLGETTVDAIRLTESDLSGPDGPTYRTVAEVPL